MTKKFVWAILALLLLDLHAGPSLAAAPGRDRQQAAAKTGAGSDQAVKRLMAQLDTGTLNERLAAIEKLGSFGAASAPAVPSIVNALNENRHGAFNGSFSSRVPAAMTGAALDALRKIGPAAGSASPYVAQLLGDRDELFRCDQILDTLASIGVDESAAPIIIKVVGQEGKFTRTRLKAINLLGTIASPPPETTDFLHGIANDRDDPAARMAALEALDKIRKSAAQEGEGAAPRDSLAVIRDKLDADQPEPVRLQTLKQVSEMGEKAVPLVPKLIQLLHEQDEKIKKGAMDALGSIGIDASTAVPSLVAILLGEADSEERSAICRTIIRVDPTGKRTLPLLDSALQDAFKARAAIQMLDEIGTDESTSMAQMARQKWCLR